MQVRVFEAADMASGLRQVKEAFGPDALILSTKTVKRGKRGLLSKPYLEITAAVDNKTAPLNTGMRAYERQAAPQEKLFPRR